MSLADCDCFFCCGPISERKPDKSDGDIQDVVAQDYPERQQDSPPRPMRLSRQPENRKYQADKPSPAKSSGFERARHSGRLSVIVLEQPTQPFLAANASLDPLPWTRPRKQQLVRLTLVVSLAVIMLAEVFQGAPQRAFPKKNEMGKAFAFH